MSGFEAWWIRQFFKIVIICAVVDIHFGFKTFSALLASLPVPGMFLHEMAAAQCITTVVARAAVSSVREQDIIILIVANPLITTICLGQFFCFTA
jgi:hypothetical protein